MRHPCWRSKHVRFASIGWVWITILCNWLWRPGCTCASSIFKWPWVLSIEYNKNVKYIQIHWKGSHYNTEPRPLPLRTCGPQCPQSKRPTKVYQGSDAFKEPTIASLAAFPVGTWMHHTASVFYSWVMLGWPWQILCIFLQLGSLLSQPFGSWQLDEDTKDQAEMPVESTMWMLRKDWHKRTKTQQQAHQVAYIGQPTKQQHRKSVGVRQPVCKVVVVLWCCMLLYSECKPIQFNNHSFHRFRCLSEAAPSYKLTESIYQSINQKCIGQSILTKQQAGFRALGQRCTAYSQVCKRPVAQNARILTFGE